MIVMIYAKQVFQSIRQAIIASSVELEKLVVRWSRATVHDK